MTLQTIEEQPFADVRSGIEGVRSLGVLPALDRQLECLLARALRLALDDLPAGRVRHHVELVLATYDDGMDVHLLRAMGGAQ